MSITRFFHFLHTPSPESILKNYLKEIVYGGNDGIITTFAVVSGFTGAVGNVDASLGASVVILFGLANLFADATSMGLGDFLSLRSEQDSYISARFGEREAIAQYPSDKKEETLRLLRSRGYTRAEAYRITDLLAKNQELWLDFIMEFKHGRSNSEENPAMNGAVTFVSFIIFGSIPLLPYFFIGANVGLSFIWAVIGAFVALLLLGILRWRVTRLQPLRSIGEVLILGIVASFIAYFVGVFVG